MRALLLYEHTASIFRSTFYRFISNEIIVNAAQTAANSERERAEAVVLFEVTVFHAAIYALILSGFRSSLECF